MAEDGERRRDSASRQSGFLRKHPPTGYNGGVVDVTPLRTAVRLPFLAFGDPRAERWTWVNGRSDAPGI
ncbi:hypothetical protein MOX02_56460 [Methylobacterium oxalidis]|uniref:Uncharacterized protein n=1 Tax=Methylobacterium oxalidis TaxID=944322 RepID=A0A512JCC7_9HYPH|nr:hypothetical protein MOX02_56460 [Methylobacterium oxalidis]GLS66192.1 hypothetical protein GCM10007888_45740 [Methylobacterium oxalidis]